MRKFAVFDFDGTLIRWQLYHAIVDGLAREGFIDKSAFDRVIEARRKWKVRESEDAFMGYQHELIKCYGNALPGLSKPEHDKAIENAVSQHKDQVYVYTRNLVANLKSKNYFLIAISGSHREAVEEVAKHYGFDDYVGTKFEVFDGKFTGNYQLASADKRQILENLVKEHNLTTKDSFAVGDSESDISILEIVENPIAFNPNKNLFEYAKARDWKIVVERKNVIYELSVINGQYILQ